MSLKVGHAIKYPSITTYIMKTIQPISIFQIFVSNENQTYLNIIKFFYTKHSERCTCCNAHA